MLITIKFLRVMDSKFSKIHPLKCSNRGAPCAQALDPPLQSRQDLPLGSCDPTISIIKFTRSEKATAIWSPSKKNKKFSMRFQHKNTPKYADADPGISEPVLVSGECFNVPFHIPCVVETCVFWQQKQMIKYILYTLYVNY